MINDLKDLRSLLTLCRSKGITEFKMNGLEIKFGDLPKSQSEEQALAEEDVVMNPYDGFPQNILSPEQLSHYAQGGSVDNDPFLRKISS